MAIELGQPDSIENDEDLTLKAPVALFEILSPGTRKDDEGLKLNLYTAVDSVGTVVIIDPNAETVRVVQRLGPTSWRNELFPQATDVEIPSVGITIPKEEIFACD